MSVQILNLVVFEPIYIFFRSKGSTSFKKVKLMDKERNAKRRQEIDSLSFILLDSLSRINLESGTSGISQPSSFEWSLFVTIIRRVF